MAAAGLKLNTVSLILLHQTAELLLCLSLFFPLKAVSIWFIMFSRLLFRGRSPLMPPYCQTLTYEGEEEGQGGTDALGVGFLKKKDCVCVCVWGVKYSWGRRGRENRKHAACSSKRQR